ncbi:MAG: Sua5/YciO/YrdC/YwlC family protein [Pseudomonadota bacterium]|nr:Sua5/YciO/YrdC/YwlC family protein [Pseudomonadota bacterium]
MPATAWRLDFAAHQLRRGGVVAYPTEAVWGLGCDPWNASATARLLSLKRRSQGQGLILIADRADRFDAFLAGLTEAQRQRVVASWPGPNTWLVPHRGLVPAWIRGGHGTVALRVPGHGEARALCAAFGAPLVSTSANPHGLPPARCRLQLERYFHRRLDAVVPGSVGGLSRPSAIRDACSGALLRN